MKILIYNSGGGLGDSIQLFDIVNSIIKKFGNDNVRYLSAHENHFSNKLKDYDLKLQNLNTDIKFFGFRLWHFFLAKRILKNNLIPKFDLVIDLQSKLRNTIILRQFSHKNFYSSTMNFSFCNIKKDYKKSTYDHRNLIINLEKLLNISIPFEKYNINKINNSYFEEAKKLLPNNNYVGFSITQGNKYRKKSWSIDKFIGLAKKASKKNKIPVFFIEKNKQELIKKIKDNVDGVLLPELDSKLSGPPLVTAMATRLEKAISIDNGLMHMIGLANIPMIVLFGPTNSKKFSPKIENIKILDSKKMYNSENIDRISVDDVDSLI